MPNLITPPSFEEIRQKEIAKKIEDAKKKFAEFQERENIIVKAVLMSDASSIRAELIILPKEFVNQSYTDKV